MGLKSSRITQEQGAFKARRDGIMRRDVEVYFDKKAVFEAEAVPLIERLIEVCNQHDLPLLLSVVFGRKVDEEAEPEPGVLKDIYAFSSAVVGAPIHMPAEFLIAASMLERRMEDLIDSLMDNFIMCAIGGGPNPEDGEAVQEFDIAHKGAVAVMLCRYLTLRLDDDLADAVETARMAVNLHTRAMLGMLSGDPNGFPGPAALDLGALFSGAIGRNGGQVECGDDAEECED